MTLSPPLLEATSLARRHPDGRQWLLDDVSVAVEAGRPLAIAGESGAGKTLLLRALAMLDPVDAGELRFQGNRPQRGSVPAFRGQVIYLHQRPVLSADTVEDALCRPFSLALHRGRTFDKPRAVGLLEQLGRDASFLGKRTADLSGGEQQLTALVRAIQLDPAVLLLDEPTASLDRRGAAAVEALLADWLAQAPDQRSYVWVGHDAQQARRVTRHAVWLRAGRTVEEDAA